jgi:biopolymer transport protein ExbB/TolQ
MRLDCEMSEARTLELPGSVKNVGPAASSFWRKPTRAQALPVFTVLSVVFIGLLVLILPDKSRASVLILDRPSEHFHFPFTIQTIMHVIFFIGLGELYVRWRIAAREKRFLNKDFLPEDDQTVLAQEDLGPVRRKVAGQFDHEHGFLPSLINMAVLQFQSSASVEQAAGVMNQHLELMSHRLDLRYGLVRFIAWLVPTIGFIGTVFSLGASLSAASVADNLDLKDIARTLGIGFDCTMIALMEAAVLVFLLHLVQEKEESALNSAGDYTLRNLINRLYVGN